VTDRVVRAVLTGSSIGAVKAFEETAVAAESSSRKISSTTTEHASKAEGAFSSIGSKLMNVGMGLAVGGVALGAVGDLVAKALGEEQTAMATLNTAMGDAGQKWTPALTEQFDKLRGHMTGLGFDSASTADAVARLVTAGVPATKAMADMSVAADLARYKNISLSEASIMLEKAAQGNAKAMKELGISSAQVKNVHGDLGKVIDLVGPKIKGQADAYSKTLPGALDVIKASITDKLLVPLGEKVMPMFERLAGWISVHSAQISAVFGGAIIALGIAFDVLGVAMDKATVIVDFISAHWEAFKPLFVAIAGGLAVLAAMWIVDAIATGIAAAASMVAAAAILLPLAPIIAVGAAVAVLAYLFITHFSQIKAVVLDAIFFIRDVFMAAINFIRDHWQAFAYGLLLILTGGLGPLVLFVATHLDQIKKFFSDLPGNIVAALGNLGQLLVAAGRQMIQGLIDGINSMAGAVGGAIKGAIGNIPGVGGALHAVGIPGFQAGAIVTKPTLALIGERGPEAVVPLHGGPAFAGGGGGGMTNVVINVYGGDPQAVVNALKTYMRANGSVPITVNAASRLGAA
jgi:hypothetical protein